MASYWISFILLLILSFSSLAFQSPIHHRTNDLQARQTSLRHISNQSTALMMGRNRGLETRSESATPLEGGMILYVKAGPDGPSSIGDCPFAHSVRLVLEEKKLDYQVQPATAESKPQWLVDHYSGKLPALRHRKDAYVESAVMCDYVDFFFPEPPLKSSQTALQEQAEAVVEGFFPALAKYFKHTPDGDTADKELETILVEQLTKLEDHLTEHNPYLVGDQVTVVDLNLAPKLYHMTVGLDAFKSGSTSVDIPKQYPRLQAYMDLLFARESFQTTVYSPETVVWGWTNARQ
ncbi:hypothetical protein MPSEU_000763300 [Mayamaea pseudoterrestris]|nr:hypothetical protein MPSEU_000763300 [Mayamaea pseudoterrestris]